MAFSPIQLTPDVDTSTMVQAINDNFRQVESENRTKIIRDEEGEEQILIGRNSNGQYGIYLEDNVTMANGAIVVSENEDTARVIFGKLPDGSYGLVISKPGVDVRGLFS